MKKTMTWAALLAVLLLLGVGTAAEASGSAVFAALNRGEQDAIAMGVGIIFIALCFGWIVKCIEDRRKQLRQEELERIRAMNPPPSLYVPPVVGGYYELPPPPPKRILIVRVIRWFFVRRR